MALTSIELFAGAGLLGGGFEQVGFESVFAAELDARAVASYNANIRAVAETWDVSNIKDQVNVDLLIAGPPCQGFSTLGNRDPKDRRNQLSLAVLDWVDSVEPSVIVIENVPQFVKSGYWKLLNRKMGIRGYASCVWG